MPTQSDRPSLSTDLESRYRNQRAGSVYDVKATLKQPGQSLQPGDRMPINGNEHLYTNDDFVVKQTLGVTEFLDAQSANNSSSPSSREMSRYMRGFTSRKYKG